MLFLGGGTSSLRAHNWQTNVRALSLVLKAKQRSALVHFFFFFVSCKDETLRVNDAGGEIHTFLSLETVKWGQVPFSLRTLEQGGCDATVELEHIKDLCLISCFPLGMCLFAS